MSETVYTPHDQVRIAIVTKQSGVLKAACDWDQLSERSEMRTRSRLLSNDTRIVDVWTCANSRYFRKIICCDRDRLLVEGLCPYDLVITLDLGMHVRLHGNDTAPEKLMVPDLDLVRYEVEEAAHFEYRSDRKGNHAIKNMSWHPAVKEVFYNTHWAELSPACRPEKVTLGGSLDWNEVEFYTKRDDLFESDLHALQNLYELLTELRDQHKMEQVNGTYILASLLEPIARGVDYLPAGDPSLQFPIATWMIPFCGTTDGQLVLYHETYEAYLAHLRSQIVHELDKMNVVRV